MLRTHLAELYLMSATDMFLDAQPQLDRAQLSIGYQFADFWGMAAACNSTETAGSIRVDVTITQKCLENLSADLDLDDESVNAFFEWRLNWLAWHEISHWFLGHIEFYRKMRWLSDVGLCEARMTGVRAAPVKPEDVRHPLAHVAELEADAFAVRRLFHLMSQIPQNDAEHGDAPGDDLQYCYYTVMTTICCFFADGQGLGDGPFHPSWQVRSLNVFTSLFGAYLERIGVDPKGLLGGDVSGLRHHASRFMDTGIQPVIDGIEYYARSLGIDQRIHGDDGDGLFAPGALLDVFTGVEDNAIVAQYLTLLRAHKDLVSRTRRARLRHGHDGEPAQIQTGPWKRPGLIGGSNS
ncbi:hypothetical protein [Amaricoccus solimangrovi]|uniref:Uncharacterized protein n=1 Tax=Amaricoccus solimangrovi TaxID=2589815 RepID=A0A501WKZ1_9RHOB|nr:hypothetical protein [Amaricoccus solimangrovi]TPE47877.1 hypothetical protein FJM51_19260 [Amaricoccus solimangrovi]